MAPKQEPDRKLVNLAFRIKPLVEDAKGDLHFIKPVDIYSVKLDDADVVKPLKEKVQLTRLTDLTIDVPAGLRAIYGPTAVQVLDQLPADIRKKAVGYTVAIREGMYSGEDLTMPARVVVYTGKLPQYAKDQPVIARGKKFTAPILSKRQIQFMETAQTEKPVAVMKPISFKKPDTPGNAP